MKEKTKIFGTDEEVYFGDFMNDPDNFSSLNNEEKNNYNEPTKNKEESKMYSFGMKGGKILNVDKFIDEGLFVKFIEKYNIDPMKVKLATLGSNIESYNIGIDEMNLKEILRESPSIYKEIEENAVNGCVPTDTAVFGQQDDFDNDQIVCGYVSAIYSEERDRLLILSIHVQFKNGDDDFSYIVLK